MQEKVNPKTLSGFMELMPREQICFDKMKGIIEDVYRSYGFYPLDTPIIEAAEVLLAKAGGETEKQIYRFNKGDSDLALRFDLTVPLAKYVASRYNELVFPFKRYQIGKVYRGERAQKGRFREFYQCDIDVIGNESLAINYDAEIPKIIYDIFKKLDIGKFVIRINNRKVLSGFFASLGLDESVSDILRIIDKLEKIGLDSVIDEFRLMGLDDSKIESIVKFISIKGSTKDKIESLKNLNINNEVFIDGVNELLTVTNNLELMGMDNEYYEIDLTIARGLDYYTGTVYETRLVDYPGIGSVCSGGRYDDLATYYTDKKLPGVGISIGLTRLFYQLKEAGIIKIEDVSVADVVILPLTSNMKYVYDVANRLKEISLNIDIAYLDKFKQLMKYADRGKTKWAVIIGDDEINEDVVILKNMESGEQQKLKIDELLEFGKRI